MIIDFLLTVLLLTAVVISSLALTTGPRQVRPYVPRRSQRHRPS